MCLSNLTFSWCNRQPPQRYHGIFPTHPQVGGIRPRSNNRTRNRERGGFLFVICCGFQVVDGCEKQETTVIHHPTWMSHHHPVLRSYNIPHGHPISKINRQRHSNILNDPPHKISSKTDNFWMYYSQIIFGWYVFPLSVTPMFYLYLIQKSFNKLHILEICSRWF